MRFLLALLLALTAGAAAAADGKVMFDRECASCHPLSGASAQSGPSLKGVVWRKIAGRSDFAYSAALRGTIGSWTPARLDAFLRDTQTFAPGTDMFWDISDPARRKAIIAFLESVK